MKQTTGGSRANYTGTILQRFIEARLIERGYNHVESSQFQPSTYLQQPTYAREWYLGKGVYDNDTRCDFILYHPQKHPDCLVVEAKWQQTGGSIDEKYVYLVTNIQRRFTYKTVVVLDGGGYRPCAEKWLRDQVCDNLVAVYDMRQFQTWANNGGI